MHLLYIWFILRVAKPWVKNMVFVFVFVFFQRKEHGFYQIMTKVLRMKSLWSSTLEPSRCQHLEIHAAKTTWEEFQDVLLVESILENECSMTWHTFMKWVEKKGKKMSVLRVYDEFNQIYNPWLSFAQGEWVGYLKYPLHQWKQVNLLELVLT